MPPWLEHSEAARMGSEVPFVQSPRHKHWALYLPAFFVLYCKEEGVKGTEAFLFCMLSQRDIFHQQGGRE